MAAVTVTEAMVNTASNKQFAAALLCLLLPGQTLAGDWKFDPTLSANERYTDNINLDATGQESSFITEVSPGFRLSRKGGRAEAHVSYSLQGLFYSHDSDANDFRNQLNAGLRAELIEEHFFSECGCTHRAAKHQFGRESGDIKLQHYR